MRVRILADTRREEQGYYGAVLELPTDRFGIEDALQRAHVQEGGRYQLQNFQNWPKCLYSPLLVMHDKTLEEVNLLAEKVSRLDEFQMAALEGAIQMQKEEDVTNPITMKELINTVYNLKSFDAYPGIWNDTMLGEVCLEGELLDLIKGLPEELCDLLDVEKVGKAQRKAEQGVLTGNSYVYRNSAEWQEVYDGIHLPEQDVADDKAMLLHLVSADAAPDQREGVWLGLPAGEEELKRALTAMGEENFDFCTITEARCLIPALAHQLAGDEDIDKLNLLAKRIQDFADRGTLVKYKAILELELCNDLDMELDLAANLNCYTFDKKCISASSFAVDLFDQLGLDLSDPAFQTFDFEGYGTRWLEENGFVATSYGLIVKNETPFVHEFTKPPQGMTMQ